MDNLARTERKKQYIIGYDIIRIVAIFLVVAIHSNVAYLAKNNGVGYTVMMEITALCLLAVPLFFMVSGATILDEEEVVSFGNLWKKRLVKQGVPFLVWSVIYVAFRIVAGKIPLGIGSFLALIETPAYYQFWFMYSLLSIYLLVPVLQLVVLHASRRQLEYVLGIWFAFSIVIPTVSFLFPSFRLSSHVDLVLCEGYIGYFLLGYYLKKYHAEMSAKKSLLLAIAGILLTGCAALLERRWATENYQGYFYQSYLTPGVVLAVTGAFCFLQNCKPKICDRLRGVIREGSRLSIGVFYIHMLWLTALEYIGFSGEYSMWITFVKCLAVYICSFASALVISKIPYVRVVLLGFSERKKKT